MASQLVLQANTIRATLFQLNLNWIHFEKGRWKKYIIRWECWMYLFDSILSQCWILTKMFSALHISQFVIIHQDTGYFVSNILLSYIALPFSNKFIKNIQVWWNCSSLRIFKSLLSFLGAFNIAKLILFQIYCSQL